MQFVFPSIDITGSAAIIETVALAPVDLDLLAILDGIPELTHWLSAADAVVPGAASSFTWRDRKSGIVGTPTQSGIPPVLANVNGLPAVKGTGAGIAYPGRTLLGATAYTRIVVAQPDAGTTGFQALFGSLSAAGPRLTTTHNPEGQVSIDNNPSSATVANQVTAGGVMPRGVTTMLVVSWSAASGQFTVRKAGATVATLPSAELPGDPGAYTVIGASIQNTADAFRGNLFEILEFNGVDLLASAAGLESLALIEGAFKAKYGVA